MIRGPYGKSPPHQNDLGVCLKVLLSAIFVSNIWQFTLAYNVPVLLGKDILPPKTMEESRKQHVYCNVKHVAELHFFKNYN